jgi:hypothetical protein
MADAPERDVVELLQEAAQSIRVDGTPAQVGLSADEHEDIAREITRLRSQVAGIPPQDRQAVADELKLVSAFLFEDQADGLMDIVERAIAMLSASPEPPAGGDGWRDISTAPHTRPIIVKTAAGRIFKAKWVIIGDDAVGWGTPEEDDPRPSCWHSGFCWASNEDEEPSDPPVGWIEMPGVSPPVSAATQRGDAEMLSIRSRLERMETALTYYANKEIYIDYALGAAVFLDRGGRARAALEPAPPSKET